MGLEVFPRIIKQTVYQSIKDRILTAFHPRIPKFYCRGSKDESVVNVCVQLIFMLSVFINCLDQDVEGWREIAGNMKSQPDSFAICILE